MRGADDVQAPKLLDKRYSLETEIGEGGMAIVWKAFDVNLKQHRAIKIIRDGGRAAALRVRRLGAEGRALARLEGLHHPNLVRVFEFKEYVDAETGEQRAYIVMDLVEGGTVGDQLRALGVLPARRSVHWIIQVLSALDVAHRAGVIHRDIKPSNILLDRHGSAVLADFGIAMLVDDEDRFTRTGVMMGSVAYAAPEQRLSARRAVPASDLYAAGATLYQMLTGQAPDHLFADAVDEPRWLLVEPPLRDVLYRAMRKAPEDRFATARAFADALERCLEALPPDPSGSERPGATWLEDSRADQHLPTLNHTQTDMDSFPPVVVPPQPGTSAPRGFAWLAFAAAAAGAVAGTVFLASPLFWRTAPTQPAPDVAVRIPPPAPAELSAAAPVVVAAPPPPELPVEPAPDAPRIRPTARRSAAVATRPIEGRWLRYGGTFGANALDLRLDGERLTGTWTRRVGEKVTQGPVVEGNWDEAAGVGRVGYADGVDYMTLDVQLDGKDKLKVKCCGPGQLNQGELAYRRMP